MNSNTETITLTEDLFLGKGAHKKCYQHPTDKNLCVKILFQTPDVDLEKELAYRKALKRRHKESSLLPSYLGVCKTNLGEGYIFECINDYDGKVSASLYDFIKSAPPTEEHLERIVKYILEFRKIYAVEKIVVSDTDPRNLMLQKLSPTEHTFRIIDNIGSPVLLPLAYYLDFVETKRAKKYWGRFMIKLKRFFPEIFSDEIINKIKDFP